MRISDWSSDVCSSDLTRERDDDEPVEGVSIFVRSAAGEDIDSAESDADGRWEIEVPDPGSYEVEIDPGSLPDGVTLRNEERTTLTVSVNPGQSKTVIRSEEHTSELQSLMRISYAVFCLNKKTQT